jgi:hypothetical protein
MKLYTAPQHVPNEDFFTTSSKIFLAGSIEQGKAKMWQDEVIEALSDTDVVVFNPRREKWNPDLPQTPDNPEFDQQVKWELMHINFSDVVFFFFQEGTMSPISLLELGLVLGSGKNAVVVCEPGFWRRGNVEITCDVHEVQVYGSLEEGIETLLHRF